MPTKTKPIKSTAGERFPGVNLDEKTKKLIVANLGIAADAADTTFREIESALSEGVGRGRWAKSVPMPAHLRAEIEPAMKAVENARAQIDGLSGYAKAVLRGTRGEGNPAVAEFVMAALALHERADEVLQNLQNEEETECKQSGREGSPGDGGGRKHKVYKERIREQGDAANVLIALSGAVRLCGGQRCVDEALWQKAAKRKLSEMPREEARWVPMRTALTAVYQRSAVKPTKRGLSAFLQIADSVFNAGMKPPRH